MGVSLSQIVSDAGVVLNSEFLAGSLKFVIGFMIFVMVASIVAGRTAKPNKDGTEVGTKSLVNNQGSVFSIGRTESHSLLSVNANMVRGPKAPKKRKGDSSDPAASSDPGPAPEYEI